MIMLRQRKESQDRDKFIMMQDFQTLFTSTNKLFPRFYAPDVIVIFQTFIFPSYVKFSVRLASENPRNDKRTITVFISIINDLIRNATIAQFPLSQGPGTYNKLVCHFFFILLFCHQSLNQIGKRWIINFNYSECINGSRAQRSHAMQPRRRLRSLVCFKPAAILRIRRSAHFLSRSLTFSMHFAIRTRAVSCSGRI